MDTVTFQGLKIKIENPAGSTRSGKSPVTGKPWSVTMPYDYGEIKGTMGIDGDPVDVFIGSNAHAKFAYVVHQLNEKGDWDEDKVMMGFDDAMKAKQAYFSAYDKPESFYGGIEAVPIKVFREKAEDTKDAPAMIHANMESTLALYATVQSPSKTNPFKVGDSVTVDGMHGRGVITSTYGDRVTVRFLNGLYLSRHYMFVHNVGDRISKMWRDK